MTQKTESSLDSSFVEGEQGYRLACIDQMLTPVLIIYMDRVDANISASIRAVGGDPGRLRPHVKTAKLEKVIRRFVASGIHQCKCATTLELEIACAGGMRDVLVAYPMIGANARRVEQLTAQYPGVVVSVLVDHAEQIRGWRPPLGIFIDVNSGMDRTGIGAERVDQALGLIRVISDSGHVFRGLHFYDGHLGSIGFEERGPVATRGYEQLAQLASAIEQAGVPVGEVITSGTFVFMFASDFPPLKNKKFINRVSPGAAFYGDLNTIFQLPSEYGFSPAALVATRVVSHPRADLFTCDAGLKAVAGFAGLPNCAVVGRSDLVPQRMSEEHLTFQAGARGPLPPIGSILYLIPRHAGLTVNNFDEAVVVMPDGTSTLEPVSARGHDSPVIGFSGGIGRQDPRNGDKSK